MFRTLKIVIFILSTQFLFAQVTVKEAFPNLVFADIVDIQSAKDGSNRLFVVSQLGYIYSFDNNISVSSFNTFLDISSVTSYGGERGLLGLAFDPSFSTNGYFYVDYTRSSPLRTVISRFEINPGSSGAVELSTEKVLIEIEQPYGNHNGGQIAFGPDGYLYIALGDGGSANDPDGNGQNRATLLGTILRIDVNEYSESQPYKIPNDNPFVGNSNGYREEIYAYGLRNPWRFCFDPVTNELWAADVGQGKWEEIDIIQNGGNYGWNIMEGLECFNPSSGCDQTGLELPIWQYGHNSEGGYSITGGYVYRGNNVSELVGKYIYGDFVTGNIWSLYKEEQIIDNELIDATNYAVSTFGVDENNELYFADYNTGKIYTFEGTIVSISAPDPLMKFSLDQNYPNPFNPSTTITYEIPNQVENDFNFVRLKVYDVLGRIVSQLVNQEQKSGTYQVLFNAENLPSGIYFARLTVGTLSKTISMQLLK